MNEYLLGLYEKSMPHALTIKEKLAYTKASGFDFLEVSIDESYEKLARLRWNKAQRREVINAVWDTGVPIGSMCLSGHRKYPLGSPDANTRRESLDIMARAIDLACNWGMRIIQLAGYDVYYEQGNERTQELFRQNLTKCVEMAVKAGVILAFETMETPFMNTVGKAMRYVTEINSPYLQVYPDLGNLTNAALIYHTKAVASNNVVSDGNTVDNVKITVSSCVAADLETGRGHIAALHLKETKQGVYRDVSYGTGHVDFASGVNAARKLGVGRFVGEFWDNGDYQAQIAHANKFLRKFLDCVGRDVYIAPL